ncbi:MAG: hypothetical protein HYS13_05120 [Planctomycetia bacterium]|nr:hypothetical protein [Planctomycetia bacterium]
MATRKMTAGQKAARTRKRKAAAARAVRTKRAKGAGRRAAATRKWNRIREAAQTAIAAIESGDASAARAQLEIIANVAGA